MTKEWYQQWQAYFKRHAGVAWLVEVLATRLAALTILVPVILVWYPLGRLYVAWTGINLVVGWLFLVQLIAHVFPQQRPYQRFEFVPVRGRGFFSNLDTRLDAFPSGHTTALCIIAFSVGVFSVGWAVLFVLLAFAAGAARVFLGWHFVRDVVGGAGLAALVVFGLGYLELFDFLQSFMV
ncbi:MAG: phosphatase PAP2 family protein [Candidatus Doudnabacteria bacterium]|nr:phosphatase PAP2 family protein [Candidatus Doudnabacteria bacterium]